MSVQLDTHVFGSAFIEQVESVAQNAQEFDGTLGGDAELHEKTRRSKVRILYDLSLKHQILSWVNAMNTVNYGFDLYQDCELQYTVYDASYKGHYDWHDDEEILNGRRFARKLSLSILLTDGQDYTGGDLEVEGYSLSPKRARQRGSAILFPSFLRHRVTPVTRGTRKSLVAWVVGPAWR